MNKDNNGNLFIIQDSNCIYYYHKKEGVFRKINITGIPISDIVDFFIDATNRMWVVMKGYNRCYDIQQEPTSGDITLLPQKTGLIYRTSLIYCFNDAESLYYIDKDYNFYAFHIPTQKNEFIANLEKEIQMRGKVSSIVHYHDSFFVGFLMDGILLLEKQKIRVITGFNRCRSIVVCSVSRKTVFRILSGSVRTGKVYIFIPIPSILLNQWCLVIILKNRTPRACFVTG